MLKHSETLSAAPDSVIADGSAGPLRILLSGWWPKQRRRSNLTCTYCGCSEWECDGDHGTTEVAA